MKDSKLSRVNLGQCGYGESKNHAWCSEVSRSSSLISDVLLPLNLGGVRELGLQPSRALSLQDPVGIIIVLGLRFVLICDLHIPHRLKKLIQLG